MLVPRRDEILARTDPFDLAQAIDRYVSLLSAGRIRSLLIGARERLGPYYRGEFLRLLLGRSGDADSLQFAKALREPHSDEELRAAFARLLKTNLRAIPVFGPAFCDGVLEYVPTDRAVAIGEERRGGAGKAAAIMGAAAVLVLAGAAGEHFIVARSQPSPSPAAYSVVPAPPEAPPPVHRHVATAASKQRIIAISSPEPTQPPSPAPTAAPTLAPTPAPTRVSTPLPTPPPARGVATVAIPDPTATPEPSPLDVTDMPDSYTDATPLPQVTVPGVQAPHAERLVTPTPKPVHHKWLYRSIMHLDPFKPHPRSTP